MLKNLEPRDKAGDDVYVKRLRDLSRILLLILDEWFACSPTKTELVFLHELIDSRYGMQATIVCSQRPSENWHSIILTRRLASPSLKGFLPIAIASGLSEKICVRRIFNGRDSAALIGSV